MQSLICDVNVASLRQLLRELTQSLLSAMLACAKANASQAGPKLLVQARVDCDFLQQRLSPLISAEASSLLEKTVQIIEEEAAAKEVAPDALRSAIHAFYAQNNSTMANLFQSFQV